MYTSYFSRFNQIIKRDEDPIKPHHGISIARSQPKGNSAGFVTYPDLAPSYSLLRDWKENDISWGEYRERYEERLETLDPEQTYTTLVELAGGDEENCTLLCWEGPDKFCHRHLVANWLEVNLGIKIKEGGEE